MDRTELKAWLEARTRPGAGDCMEWALGLHHENGQPRARIDNKNVLVRKFVWQTDHPGSPVGKRLMAVTCDNSLCVNPKHIVARTARAVYQAAAARGAFSSPTANARRAAAARRTRSKHYSPELAAWIRARRGEGVKLGELAAELQAKGVQLSKKRLGQICRHEAWNDVSHKGVAMAPGASVFTLHMRAAA